MLRERKMGIENGIQIFNLGRVQNITAVVSNTGYLRFHLTMEESPICFTEVNWLFPDFRVLDKMGEYFLYLIYQNINHVPR